MKAWDKLDPRSKRLTVFALAGTVFSGFMYMVLTSSEAEVAEFGEDARFESILRPGDTRQASLEGIAALLEENQSRIQRIEESQRNQRAVREQLIQGQIDRLRQDMTTGDARTQEIAEAQIAAFEAALGGRQLTQSPSDFVSEDPSDVSEQVAILDDSGSDEDVESVYEASPLAAEETVPVERIIYAPTKKVEEPEELSPADAVLNKYFKGGGTVGQGPAVAQNSVGAVASGVPELGPQSRAIRLISVEENLFGTSRAIGGEEVSLPAGSILTGVLLNGLDAPGGAQASSDPLPVLLRLKHEAILPNGYSADVRECFLLMSAFGELSAERAMMRGEEFSCILNDGTVMQKKIKGYVVGEDGKAGIRGNVVSKRGQLIANAVIVGALEAASNAVSDSTDVALDVASGGISRGSATSAISAGTSSALDRIAEWYLDQADQIFPVVEIQPGRRVDFILTGGLTFRLDL